jgi:hypothetical protein
LAWQDQTAALICFHIGGSQHLKLFVTDRPADADLPPEGEVKMIEYDDWAAALWSEKDKTYLLAGKVHPASLRRFLL